MMIIDRFEQDFAVVETDDGMINIEREYLPEDSSEGDVIVPTGNGYIIDEEATAQRRKSMAERLNRLTGRKE